MLLVCVTELERNGLYGSSNLHGDTRAVDRQIRCSLCDGSMQVLGYVQIYSDSQSSSHPHVRTVCLEHFYHQLGLLVKRYRRLGKPSSLI